MTEMHCDEFVELVTAYLDGALDPADRARVAGHLDQCDGCSRYLEQFRATIAILAIAPPTDPLDRDVKSALLNAFRSPTDQQESGPV